MGSPDQDTPDSPALDDLERLSRELATCLNLWEIARALIAEVAREPEVLKGRDFYEYQSAAWYTTTVEVRRWVETLSSSKGDVSARESEDLLEILARRPTTSLAIGAHAAASVIDELRGYQFVRLLRSSHPWSTSVALTPGTIYPRLEFDLKSRNPDWVPPPRRASSADDPCEMPHVRVWQPLSELSVTLDWTNADAIQRLLEETEYVATCHPQVQYSAQEYSVPNGPLKFPIIPLKGDELIADLWQAARNEGARIVVFPELSMTPQGVMQLRDLVQSDPETCMAVAGSCHVGSGKRAAGPILDMSPWARDWASTGPCRNVAIAWLKGSDRPLVHLKFRPWSSRQAHEGIDELEPTVAVHIGGEWAVVLAICKDVLEERTRSDVASAGANLLLIPAMSRRVGGFQTAASLLSTDTQGFTVVANGPRQWPIDDRGTMQWIPGAVFGVPRDVDHSWTEPKPLEQAEPGYALLQLWEGISWWRSATRKPN